MARLVTGLDIGAHTVKAFQVAKAFGKPWELVKIAEQPLPEEARGSALDERAEEVRSAFLNRFLKSNGLLGGSVVAALPADRVMTHVLHFPQTNPQVIRKIYQGEIEDLLPFDLDEAVVDFRVLSKSSEGTTILVAAAPREAVASMLEMLSKAGIPTPSLELESTSFSNLETRLVSAWKGRRVALLDLGAKKSTLLLYNDGLLDRVRVFPVGGFAIDEEAARLLDCTPGKAEMVKESGARIVEAGRDEELGTLKLSEAVHTVMDPLLSEIGRTLRQAESAWKAPLDAMYITGGTARIDGMDRLVAGRLDHPCERLNPADFVMHKLNGQSGAAAGLSPFGLGLALRQGAPANINFRQAEFAAPSKFDKAVQKRLATLGMIAGLVFLAWLARSLVGYQLDKSHVRHLRADIAAIYTDATGETAPAGMEVQLLRQKVDAVMPKGDGSGSITLLDALGRMSNAIQPGYKVDIERLDMGSRGDVKIKAKTNMIETVSSIEAALKQVPEFKNVLVNKTDIKPDGVDFSLTVEY